MSDRAFVGVLTFAACLVGVVIGYVAAQNPPPRCPDVIVTDCADAQTVESIVMQHCDAPRMDR